MILALSHITYCAPTYPREKKKKLNPEPPFGKKSTVSASVSHFGIIYYLVLSCPRLCLVELVWLAGDSGILSGRELLCASQPASLLARSDFACLL